MVPETSGWVPVDTRTERDGLRSREGNGTTVGSSSVSLRRMSLIPQTLPLPFEINSK